MPSIRFVATARRFDEELLVCEVEYLEVTPQLHLRAPSFKRMRDDKLPEDCTLDQIKGP